MTKVQKIIHCDIAKYGSDKFHIWATTHTLNWVFKQSICFKREQYVLSLGLGVSE